VVWNASKVEIRVEVRFKKNKAPPRQIDEALLLIIKIFLCFFIPVRNYYNSKEPLPFPTNGKGSLAFK